MSDAAATKDNLTRNIFIGLMSGIGLGLLLHSLAGGEGGFINAYVVEGVLFVLGKIFVNLLKLMIVPLVLVSLVCGVMSSEDGKGLGRLGAKTFALYLVTTAVAITLAIGVALVLDPGSGVDLNSDYQSYQVNERPPFTQVLIDIFPSNPVDAMAEGNMLQVIVFAILLGIAINHCGAAGQRVGALFLDFNQVVMKLVQLIMQLAPYGVFVLVAQVAAKHGLGIFKELGMYMFCVLLALLMHLSITYMGILSLVARLNPLVFLKKMRSPMMFAFSTASSAATMPVTLRTVEYRLGVKNSVASFTIPLGTTVNMDGTAIMQGVATVFVASAYGVDLSLSQYLLVILTATMASIGTAAVPSAGMITLAMVLGQVGLPAEAIGLIIGVDRVLDMARTAVNVAGDATVTCTVAKSENAMDLAVYSGNSNYTDAEESTSKTS